MHSVSDPGLLFVPSFIKCNKVHDLAFFHRVEQAPYLCLEQEHAIIKGDGNGERPLLIPLRLTSHGERT